MNTIEPGTIVVAVDGSDHAERAVRWAADQAALEGRRLLVVSAGREDGHQVIAEEQAALASTFHPGLDVEPLTLPGDARSVLVDLSTQAHLLVVGSRGRGAFKTALLGSVGAAVSAQAACPVVVCRPAVREATRGVLVGADGTPESAPVIEFAYQQAALRGLPLTVLHCFWDAVVAVAEFRTGQGEAVDSPDLADLRARLTASVETIRSHQAQQDVPVTIGLRHGLVDEALTSRSETWDLIVVGRHPMTSVTRVLTGSIATAVVERARTTVAVVPEPVPVTPAAE